jgi:hypothetical protein
VYDRVLVDSRTLGVIDLVHILATTGVLSCVKLA